MLKIKKEELIDLYISQNKTQKEISEILGYSSGYVCLLLRRNNITKNKSKCIPRIEKPHKNILEELYLVKSIQEISGILSVSKDLVYTWLTEYGIKRKIISQEDLPLLTKEQDDITIGSLLGDAWISYNENCNCKFMKTQCNPKNKPNRKEYLQWHFEKFNQYSLPLIYFFDKVNTLPNKEQILTNGCIFKTHAHSVFNEYEKKWYLRDDDGNHVLNNIGRRIKIVPRNIVLTPLSLAIWYCDDGCNQFSKRQIELCTQGFTIEECNFLVERLNKDLGIDSHVYKNMIRVPSSSYVKFIELIKPHITWNCFDYKLKYRLVSDQIGENNHRAKIDEEQAISVFVLYENNTIDEISKKLGISKSAVSLILKGKNWKHLKLSKNQDLSLRNKTGQTGIYHKKNGRWEVKIMRKGKTYRGGVFNTLEEAILAKNNLIRQLEVNN